MIHETTYRWQVEGQPPFWAKMAQPIILPFYAPNPINELLNRLERDGLIKRSDRIHCSALPDAKPRGPVVTLRA